MSNVVALRPSADVPRPRPDSELVRTVTAWLRATQLRLGISFEQWARRAKVAPTSLSKFLASGHPIPKMETLGKLADYAGLDLGSIFQRATPSGVFEVQTEYGAVPIPAQFAGCFPYIIPEPQYGLALGWNDVAIINDAIDAEPHRMMLIVVDGEYRIGMLGHDCRIRFNNEHPSVALSAVRYVGTVVYLVRNTLAAA